jgi:hypothetical protein
VCEGIGWIRLPEDRVLVVDFCEEHNGHMASVKGEKFLEYLNDLQFSQEGHCSMESVIDFQ